MIYYTDLSWATHSCSKVMHFSEVNGGFISQCERKQNYFVHGFIRLQVQQAYACIIEL